MSGRVEPHPPLLRRYAVELGAGQRLPFEARSLTAAEVAAQDRRFVRWVGGAYLLFAVALVVGTAFDGDPQLTLALAVVVLAAVAFLWPVARRYERRRQDYVDPHIVLELREAWLTVRHPGDPFDIRYGEADLAFHWTIYRHTPNFRGIRLGSPIGELRIDDDHYWHGRIAAAAIARRCDQAGLFRGLPER